MGQKHVSQTLKHEIENDTIAHAYLFAGHRGTGKTSMARLFAKAINCKDRKGSEPCNKCIACEEINRGSSVDIIEIDAASNRGIDDIRALREAINYRPNLLKYKVIILDEAHQLSKDAANALLKILEEPPEYVIFILATTEAHKMISTIASRCQRFDFHKLTIKEIKDKLAEISKKEKVKVSDEALDLVSSCADGSLRDAKGILDQIFNFTEKKEITAEDIRDVLGLVDMTLVLTFADLVVKNDIPGAVKELNDNIEKGLNVEEFSKSFITYLRKLMILQISPSLAESIAIGETKETKEKLIAQSKEFNGEDLKHLLDLLLDAENKRKYSSIVQLPLELALVEYYYNKKS